MNMTNRMVNGNNRQNGQWTRQIEWLMEMTDRMVNGHDKQNG